MQLSQGRLEFGLGAWCDIQDYNPAQLEKLKELRKRLDRSEASLLREALDDLLRKYDQRDQRRWLARMFGWGTDQRSG